MDDSTTAGPTRRQPRGLGDYKDEGQALDVRERAKKDLPKESNETSSIYIFSYLNYCKRPQSLIPCIPNVPN